MASYSKRVATISKTMKIAEISGMIQSESKVTNVEVRPSINHVICIDVSGSMWDVLSQIRTQLKSKLVDIVGDSDTVTLIKFGNEGSIISEMVQVSKASDVRELNKLIDKELKCDGCTNFLDPVKLTNELITRMNKSKGLWDFFFMSDGGHNTGGTWTEVVQALSTLQSKISNATICEYGYWADSAKLTQMAEVLGGQKIFDKDFDEYQVDFENIMKTGSTETVKRVEFDITDFKSLMRFQFMYTIDEVNRVIKVYSTERTDTILIPENTERIYYVEKNQKGDVDSDLDNPMSVYAAIYLLADRLKYDQAEELLHGIRDKELIEMYCNSFGKQKLELFKEAVLARAYGDTRCDELSSSDFKPNSKRYCVLDFIEDLVSSPMNLVHLTHPDFEYTLTTAKSVKKIELTDEDRDKLSKTSTKLKADKILKSAAEYQVQMAISDPNIGYSVKNVVWNNERASLSVQANIPVTLTVPLKDNVKETQNIASFITRNYTIIKDGILNTPKLILTVDSRLRGKLKRMKLVTKTYPEIDDNMIQVDISSLPIINKKYTETVYSMDLATKELELLKCRTINKYLGYLKKKMADVPVVKSEISEDEYLKSLGITSKGYSPKTELDKSGDFYMATILDSKIEKFSNLPKIEDVLKKRESGKPFTVSEAFMNTHMNFIDAIINNSASKEESLNNIIEVYKKGQKSIMEAISKIKFVMIVSRKWFADKADFDDNKVLVNIEGNDLNLSFVFTEKKIDL